MVVQNSIRMYSSLHVFRDTCLPSTFIVYKNVMVILQWRNLCLHSPLRKNNKLVTEDVIGYVSPFDQTVNETFFQILFF